MDETIDLIISLDNKEIKIRDSIEKSIGQIIKDIFYKEKKDIKEYSFFKESDKIDINNDDFKLYDIKKEYNNINNKNIIKILSFKNNSYINSIDIITERPEEIKSIICPECNQYIIMDINEYKINLFKCKKGHVFNNILLQNFYSTQKYHLVKSLIKENLNKEIKKEEENIKENNIPPPTPLSIKDIKNINANEENSYIYSTKCEKHKLQQFSSYCLNCRKNLCAECEMNHNVFRNSDEELHNIVHFYEILSNNDEYVDKLKANINKFRLKLDILKIELSKLINIINSVINNYEIYYNIYNDLISNYEIVERNYHILKNIKNIKFKEIFDDIDKISNEGHYYKKFEKTFEIYNKMTCLSEIKIQYFPNNQKKIRLFGQKFVNNNYSKCKLVINNQYYNIFESLNISKDLDKYISSKNGIFEIKLKLNPNTYLTDMSHMFKDCSSLLYLPNISELNTFNVTDMSYLFYGCTLIERIPNIEKWNLSNVKNLSYMFFNCNSLMSLSDISSWDISNVKDISHLFSNCASLDKLPNLISNWNTENVENLSYLFYYCLSLKELPDISKWNISKAKDISYMFACCEKLIKLPDISAWDTSLVNNMEYLFYGCKKLNSIPDISKWNTKNVTNMGFMFDELNDKVKIPKINPSECIII